MKKKKLYIFLSFLIPFISFSIIFYCFGLFTHKTILSGDMQVQYYPLFNYLKDIFNNDASLFYSFNKGLGGSMFGTFFYYLSSPLNMLFLLIEKTQIINFVPFLVILKLSLSGLTMYIYMRYKFKKENISLLVFSLCYAFMGYNLNYFINIMWLDVVIMTPLVLLGIEKILENKSPLLYIITLFISIFSNYYLSYMLCLFSVLYFIYQLLLKYKLKEDKKLIKKLTIKFILSSLLTGLSCSFFLIPCIIEMTQYERIVNLDQMFYFDYNFFDIFSKTYIGSLNLNNTLNATSMNLYTGIITLPLVFLYLVNKNINKKERIITLLFLAIMILPCFIGVLNYAWHLFTIPSFYNYRFSFLTSFLLIIIAYKSLNNLNISLIKILNYLSIYLIISLYFIVFTSIGKYFSYLNYKLIWTTLLFLIIYLFILYKINKRKNTIISIILMFEIVLNATIIFKNFEPLNKNEIYNNEVIELIEKYKNENYRIEVSSNQLMNDGLYANYNGTSVFLSTINNRMLKFYEEYGLHEYGPEYSNFYSHNIENYPLESILGIKYLITNTKIEKYNLVEEKTINDNKYYVYENPNSNNYGFEIQDKCNNVEKKEFYNENILNCILKDNIELYEEIKKDKNEEYNLKENEFYYIFLENIIDTDFINENEQILEQTLYIAKNYTLYKSRKNEKIKPTFSNEQEKEKLKIYKFNYNEFENIKYNKFNITEKNNNSLKGTIESNDGKILMITIPYEKGYEIYNNGEKVKYYEVINTFIGIDLKEGLNNIEIRYKQPGLKLGIIISLCSFAGISFLVFSHERERKYEKDLQ